MWWARLSYAERLHQDTANDKGENGTERVGFRDVICVALLKDVMHSKCLNYGDRDITYDILKVLEYRCRKSLTRVWVDGQASG